ncbi:hypothetical protein [Blastococcus colisei]|uniref:hypothetical protein n=1 Tax=Blastococcus colisei TaxID=1564162 RepID=UPI00114FBC12|nr:hypothetical protein [Blastococcus colisei]
MSRLDLPPDDEFGIDNLPYGTLSTSDTHRRTGVRIVPGTAQSRCGSPTAPPGPSSRTATWSRSRRRHRARGGRRIGFGEVTGAVPPAR